MMGLNPAQRNSVTIALRRMEQTLANLSHQAGQDETGILYRRRLSLSAAEQEKMRSLIASARQEIAALAERFQLEAEEEDGRHTAAAHLSYIWTMLEDIRPRKLKRYGEVDPALAESLEPGLDRLIALTVALKRLLAPEG
jgi:hypothetical protein